MSKELDLRIEWRARLLLLWESGRRAEYYELERCIDEFSDMLAKRNEEKINNHNKKDPNQIDLVKELSNST